MKTKSNKKIILYKIIQNYWKACVYCKNDHKSSNCKTITKVGDCKKTVIEKKLRFNYTGKKYSAAVKAHVKHVKVNIILDFANSKVQ